MCTTSVPGSHGVQKRVSDPPELKLQVILNQHANVGSKCEDQWVLLTAESPLQLQHSIFEPNLISLILKDLQSSQNENASILKVRFRIIIYVYVCVYVPAVCVEARRQFQIP